MEIKTKYSLDETVFVVISGELRECVVSRVSVDVIATNENVKYRLISCNNGSNFQFNERDISLTKVHAFKKWLDKENIDSTKIFQGFIAHKNKSLDLSEVSNAPEVPKNNF